MALKRFIDKLEDVAEALRALYRPSPAGGFELDADDADSVRKTVDEFRTNNRNLHRENEELKQLIGKFKGIDPEKAKEAQAALDRIDQMEEGKLIKEGKLDDVIGRRTAKLRSELEGQIKSAEKRAAEMEESFKKTQGRLHRMVIEDKVRATVTKVAQVRPEAIPDVLRRAREVWVMDEKENLVPKDPATGEIIYGAKGNNTPLSLEEWTEGLVKDAPHFFEASGGSGSKREGSRPATGNQSSAGKVVVDSSDPYDMGRNAQAIAEGKAILR